MISQNHICETILFKELRMIDEGIRDSIILNKQIYLTKYKRLFDDKLSEIENEKILNLMA